MLANQKHTWASYSSGGLYVDILLLPQIYFFKQTYLLHVKNIVPSVVCLKATCSCCFHIFRWDLLVLGDIGNICCGVSHANGSFLSENEPKVRCLIPEGSRGAEEMVYISPSSANSRNVYIKNNQFLPSAPKSSSSALIVLEIHSRNEAWIEWLM